MGNADGMAFHWYAGEPEVMAEVAEKFPGIDIYVTEASYDRPADLGCMLQVTAYCARSLRSGAQGYIMWNMALSYKGGPALNGNTWNSGLLEINEDEGTANFTGDYYSMAHFSKFIHQGAVALDSTDTGIDSNYKLINVVTRNPNGTMTAVVVNRTNEAEVLKFVLGEQIMEVNVEGRSIVTLTWDAN
jgi:glucosylceramidase